MHGPLAWFEARSVDDDVVVLDASFVSKSNLVALRLCRWRGSGSAAGARAVRRPDGGRLRAKVLPFIEQAQQKLFASKWRDGDAAPPVRRRVSELARDVNACTAALDACRARHELLGPDGTARVGGAPVDDGARALEKQYAECVSLAAPSAPSRACRRARRARRPAVARGRRRPRGGVVGRGGRRDVPDVRRRRSWPSHIDGVVPPRPRRRRPLHRALGQLAAQTTRVQLEQRMQYALFASALATALFGGSLPHPARPIDYAGYRLKELWPAQPVFDDVAFGELRLLDGLNAAAHALLEYDQPLPALPLLVLYKYLSVSARDVPRTPPTRSPSAPSPTPAR